MARISYAPPCHPVADGELAQVIALFEGLSGTRVPSHYDKTWLDRAYEKAVAVHHVGNGGCVENHCLLTHSYDYLMFQLDKADCQCSLCNGRADAYWNGRTTINICRGCAAVNLPALIADAVFDRDLHEIDIKDIRAAYWQAISANYEMDAIRRRRAEKNGRSREIQNDPDYPPQVEFGGTDASFWFTCPSCHGRSVYENLDELDEFKPGGFEANVECSRCGRAIKLSIGGEMSWTVTTCHVEAVAESDKEVA